MQIPRVASDRGNTPVPRHREEAMTSTTRALYAILEAVRGISDSGIDGDGFDAQAQASVEVSRQPVNDGLVKSESGGR
jgi:hypothetical protein